MKWTRGQGIPVGVRGSGATSLVAWALDITNLDPIRFGLLFERFLNPERISMPDFDIDFCQERRDEVVRYVRDKYGEDRVAHIIALGSLQARAAVRDVGRVLQMPLGLVDRIAKLIPNPPGHPMSLREAMESEPRLQQIAEQEPMAERLFSIVGKIEGLYRHASTHPAGVVIGDRPLDEILPLYRDPRSEMPVTQFDYEDAEKAGLVKFDFLGLKTLTVIAKAEELLKRRGIDLDTQTIDFDDPPTFEMLARGDSVGVFQLEGAGMRDLMRKMKPDHINDLVALVALYRPGPMDSIPKYIACKNGKEAPEYLHPVAGADPEGNLRRDDVSGRRHAHRPRAGRLFDGPGRSAAPRHGQEDPVRDGQAPRVVHQGRGREGHPAVRRRTDFRAGGEIRRLRLQQGPCRGLCAGRLSDGLSEGELSGRISRRLDDAGYRQRPTGSMSSARKRSAWASRCCRRTSTAPKPFRLRRRGQNVIFYALAAVKGVGRQAMDHVVAVRSAGGPFKSAGRFRPPGGSEAGQQARLRKPGARRRLRSRSIPTAASWSKIPPT